MSLRQVGSFLISLLLTAGIVLAQQRTPAPMVPSTPPTLSGEGFSVFFQGGSFLGVFAENISKENMSKYGLHDVRGVGVIEVVKDSPAEKAGLRKDDVILRFDGENVSSVRKLTRLISEVAPDQTVRVGIARSGSEQEVSVTISKRNDYTNTLEGLQRLQGLEGLNDLQGPLKGLERVMPPGGGTGPNVWKWETPEGGDNFAFAFGNSRRIGVTTMQLTKQLADYFGVSDGEGVLVTSVAKDSAAEKAGIKAGDVITAVDGEKIEGSGDLSRGINKKKEGDVTLTIIRNKSQRSVTVSPKAAPAAQPMVVPQVGRLVIPRIVIPMPEVNVRIPQIQIPAIPEIDVRVMPGPGAKVRRVSTRRPI
jgi:serine protease Do